MNKYFYRVDFTCPKDFYPLEKQEFRLSRYALSELTKTHLHKECLEIKDHDYLSEAPNCRASLSHTKEAASAIISLSPQILGVGIDIESKDRKHRAGAEKYFKTEDDDKSLSLIELWCAKEAAYKASYPKYNKTKTLVIKDFIIKENYFYAFGQKLGEIHFESQKNDQDNYIVAIALLLKDFE